jgi:hypothetical protein
MIVDYLRLKVLHFSIRKQLHNIVLDLQTRRLKHSLAKLHKSVIFQNFIVKSITFGNKILENYFQKYQFFLSFNILN